MENPCSYQASLQNPGPLQSHCDAVEEDKDQDHVVEELMSNNGLTEQSEPDLRETKGLVDVSSRYAEEHLFTNSLSGFVFI